MNSITSLSPQPSTQLRKSVAGSSRIKKHVLLFVAVGLMALNAIGAGAPDRPLHVLYLGPVAAGNNGRGGGNRGGVGFTNYIYLSGQTLAPKTIYFDHLTNGTDLTSKYLSHFDAVVQVVQDTDITPAQVELLASFQKSGHGIVKYADGKRPSDTV